MTGIAELERRITAALERIGRGIDGLAARPPAGVAADDGDAVTALRAALAAERDAAAQIADRLRVAEARDGAADAELQARLAAATRALDAQTLELNRLRKTTAQLRETLRGLQQSQTEGVAEPHLLNQAMLVELEALRALRQTDLAEMDEILAALHPLITEATDARA